MVERVGKSPGEIVGPFDVGRRVESFARDREARVGADLYCLDDRPQVTG